MPLTDLSFLNQYAIWPPEGEHDRLERYETNRKLWRGDHDAVFGAWWRVLREDKEAALELVFNWHMRLSTLWADLLVGEPPRFLASDENGDPSPGNQKHLDRIAGKDDNGYVTTLQETAIDISRFGDGIQKITLEEDGAAIWPQPPSYWFPVVDPTNIRKYKAHVLAWEMEPEGDRRFLWIEIHTKGQIEYRAHELHGEFIGEPVPIQKYKPERATPFEKTGVDDFLVVPFSGLRASDEIHGVDDYKNLDTVIQAIEVRAALINKILDEHSDPSMYGDPQYLKKNKATGEYEFKAGGHFFPVEGGNEDATAIPGYITWDGKLESAFAELEFLLEQLYVMSETSPAAFGQQKAGLAESGSALRRLMMAPLAKVARITMRFDPAARPAIKIASMLENANQRGTPVLEHVQIQWQDGLPGDPREQAETEAIRTGNQPTTSQVSAARRLDGGTQEEAQAEIDRINEEGEKRAKDALERAEAIAATRPDPTQDTQADRAPKDSGAEQPAKEK